MKVFLSKFLLHTYDRLYRLSWLFRGLICLNSYVYIYIYLFVYISLDNRLARPYINMDLVIQYFEITNLGSGWLD